MYCELLRNKSNKKYCNIFRPYNLSIKRDKFKYFLLTNYKIKQDNFKCFPLTNFFKDSEFNLFSHCDTFDQTDKRIVINEATFYKERKKIVEKIVANCLSTKRTKRTYGINAKTNFKFWQFEPSRVFLGDLRKSLLGSKP